MAVVLITGRVRRVNLAVKAAGCGTAATARYWGFPVHASMTTTASRCN